MYKHVIQLMQLHNTSHGPKVVELKVVGQEMAEMMLIPFFLMIVINHVHYCNGLECYQLLIQYNNVA